MPIESSRRHQQAWIPWILVLVAWLGFDAIAQEACQTDPHDATDGVSLSAQAKILGTHGRTSDPLASGAPTPPTTEALHCLAGTLLKLPAGKSSVPESLRLGGEQGRAPPFGV